MDESDTFSFSIGKSRCRSFLCGSYSTHVVRRHTRGRKRRPRHESVTMEKERAAAKERRQERTQRGTERSAARLAPV